MGMSHENCEHPRTPAGRAWCRSNGGPGSGAVWGSLPDNEPTMKVARTGGRPSFAEAVRSTIITPPAKTRRAREPKVSISDMPRIFRTAVDWAEAHECTVNSVAGNKDSVRVQLTRANVGTLTLTYSHATPEGVHAVSWRPVGTSVTSRVTNVNEGLAKLKGE
jgi:hypothetical protein